MQREALLREPEWYKANIQNDLYNLMYEYMQTNNLKKKDLAEKLGVSKAYIKADIEKLIVQDVENSEKAVSVVTGFLPITDSVDIEHCIRSKLGLSFRIVLCQS